MTNSGALIEKKFEKYSDGIAEAEKPISDRKRCFTGRNGESQSPRRHHMKDSKKNDLLQKMSEEGRFVSPFTKYGAYDGVIAALSQLGENKEHLAGDVLKAFENYMSEDSSKGKSDLTAWERFRDRSPRSQETALDAFGRFMQNIVVLQRIGGKHPYAVKLAQLGACIDVIKSKDGAPLIRLRTGVPGGERIIPINEMKKRKCPRPSGIDYLISLTRDSGSFSDGEDS